MGGFQRGGVFTDEEVPIEGVIGLGGSREPLEGMSRSGMSMAVRPCEEDMVGDCGFSNEGPSRQWGSQV